jgi:hypothetical protein
MAGQWLCRSGLPLRSAAAHLRNAAPLDNERSQTQVAVDVAAWPDNSDRDQLLSVIHGVDDPVIADPYPQPRPVALEQAGACGPRIMGKRAHRGEHITAGGLVELTQVLAHPWASLHAVGAARELQR